MQAITTLPQHKYSLVHQEYAPPKKDKVRLTVKTAAGSTFSLCENQSH